MTPPTTPICATGCRRLRSLCPGRLRSTRYCIRRRRRICTSSRAATDRVNSPPTSPITVARWRNTRRTRARTPPPMSQPPRRGRFITLEGIDGAGQRTHLPWLKERLERDGHSVWATREPGGTPLGEKLREVLLHEAMTPLGEALLMFAARREHCEREIWPRLARGTWIVCDRSEEHTPELP